MDLSWGSLQSWGELAQVKLTEAADIAQNKFNEAYDQISTRAQPPVEIGGYKVARVKRLAEGGFSEVFLAKDVDSEERFALKRMVCQTTESKADAKNELKLLKSFGKHPNIISLTAASAKPIQIPGQRRESLEVHFLFPLFEEGTVFDAMWEAIEGRRKGGRVSWPFPERRLLRIAQGACKGLLVMHSRGIAHRDVKPHNILLHRDGTPVLMDLGSACPARRDVASRQDAIQVEDDAANKCSAPYRAPELTEVSYPCCIDERVDVWSMGCTMYAMAFGNNPFESEVEGVKRLAILNGKYSFPPGNTHMGLHFSEPFCELISRMLVVDPADRPFLQEVVVCLEALLEGRPLPSKLPSQGIKKEVLESAKAQHVPSQLPSSDSQSSSPPRPPSPKPVPAAPKPTPAPVQDLLSFDFDGPAPSQSSSSSSDEFGAFASSPMPSLPSGPGTSSLLGGDDDFGDFVGSSPSFPSPVPASSVPQPMSVQSFSAPQPTSGAAFDFTDFQSALPSAPTPYHQEQTSQTSTSTSSFAQGAYPPPSSYYLGNHSTMQPSMPPTTGFQQMPAMMPGIHPTHSDPMPPYQQSSMQFQQHQAHSSSPAPPRARSSLPDPSDYTTFSLGVSAPMPQQHGPSSSAPPTLNGHGSYSNGSASVSQVSSLDQLDAFGGLR